MTERLADISARIDGVEKLGSVVNAMRGIAAARARQAQAELNAVDSYAATIKAAIGRILPMVRSPDPDRSPRARRATIVFVAQDGFVGNFSETVLEVMDAGPRPATLLIVGTRGAILARERGLEPDWQGAMPSRTQTIPRFSDTLARAVYEGMARGTIGSLDVLYASIGAGGAIEIRQQVLLPLDPSAMRDGSNGAPLLQLPATELLTRLAGEYLHAQLCHAALHAFAAENQARMEAMARTHGQVERMLGTLQMRERIVRQEEITAEIIELAAGETANRDIRR